MINHFLKFRQLGAFFFEPNYCPLRLTVWQRKSVSSALPVGKDP